MKEQTVMSLLTENPNGVLARVIALFSRHGVTIGSLSVSATAQQGVSRITVTTEGKARGVAQLASQIRRLVDIRQVALLEGGVRRELLVAKLAASSPVLFDLARQYQAEVLTAADGCPVVEFSGAPATLDALLEELAPCQVVEFSRTVVAAPELTPMRSCG